MLNFGGPVVESVPNGTDFVARLSARAKSASELRGDERSACENPIFRHLYSLS